jgi:hypothetical protein
VKTRKPPVPIIPNPFANPDLIRITRILALTLGAAGIGFLLGHWIGTY